MVESSTVYLPAFGVSLALVLRGARWVVIGTANLPKAIRAVAGTAALPGAIRLPSNTHALVALAVRGAPRGGARRRRPRRRARA